MAENAGNKESLNHNVKIEFRETGAENSAHNEQSFELAEESELRIEVGGSSIVKVELSSGFAEIFGTEMEINKEYSLSQYSCIPVFTWHGCGIKVKGNPEVVCVAKNSHMMLNVLLHATIEERRQLAVTENKNGPVVLVVGPNDVDKRSLCRILLNYAVRLGHHPVFIDLDVGQNSISLPSSVGVLVAKKPADIVTGFNSQDVEAYHYGYSSPWQYMINYFLLVQKLGRKFQTDVKYKNQNVRTSGVIISGCDWSKSEVSHHGYNAITLVTKHFQIDVICILQEEALYSQLRKDMPSSVEVIFIPKINGCKRKFLEKNQSRETCIFEYFYGLPNQLQPFAVEVKYSDIKVFQAVSQTVSKSTRVLDQINENGIRLLPVKLNVKLLDQILALSSADAVQEDIMFQPVVGFVCVVKVDPERKNLTLLSPQPGPLSKKILLKGSTRLQMLREQWLNSGR